MAPESTMVERARDVFDGQRLLMFAGAILVGVGIGSAISPDPEVLPVVGAVPGLVFAAVAIALGGLLYKQPWTDDACGCSGDCSC